MANRDRLSERQRNILRFMESYVDTHGFPPTIREIGEATGINSTSVVNYNLNKLVQAGFLTRVASKSRGLRLTTSGKADVKKVQPVSFGTRVPMYGQIVAGAPVPIPDDAYVNDDDFIEVSKDLLGKADPAEVFALRVNGDSMIDAMIQDGDIVIFRKQDVAQNGDMVAVWLEDRGETTLKYFHREGERVRLQPAHPTMDPIYVDARQCHIQGRVLSVIRHIG
jgi:repressor LexA